MAPGDGGIRLHELVEQRLQAFGRDAGAGVCHPQHQLGPVDVEDDPHRARGGELHRVADEVVQHLAHPHRVAAPLALRGRRDLDGDEDVLGRRQGAERGLRVADELFDVDDAVLQVDPPSLDLGEVQEVVQQVEQGVA
jgi:hypothetical protein